MRLPYTKPRGRRGFTLIELLVVIAIMGILVALTTAAVMHILNKGPQLNARNDIQQFAAGVQQFKSKYGFLPPSRLRLYKVLANYNPQSDPLDADSIYYMSKIAPRITDKWATIGIDWDLSANGGKPNDPNWKAELEGDQCLVFFLGGIQTNTNGTNTCLGFTQDAADPAAGRGDRIHFFDFQAAQLITYAHAKNGVAPSWNFFSYGDPFTNTPYAYFSSYRKDNNYNRYYAYQDPALGQNASDCASLGVWPYAQGPQPGSQFPALVYLNPATCQIITAGPDGQFGTGTTPNSPSYWSTATAASYGPPGRDDMSNFSTSALGAGQ